MTRPNLPAGAADIARLVARVEQLERQFRNPTVAQNSPSTASSGLPYAFGSGAYTNIATNLIGPPTSIVRDDDQSSDPNGDILFGTFIVFRVPGWYSITAHFVTLADAGGDTYDQGFSSLSSQRLRPNHLLTKWGPVSIINSGKHGYYDVISTVGYFEANEDGDPELELQLGMLNGGATTWSGYIDVHIERLPD